jgi:hypothetical protein
MYAPFVILQSLTLCPPIALHTDPEIIIRYVTWERVGTRQRMDIKRVWYSGARGFEAEFLMEHGDLLRTYCTSTKGYNRHASVTRLNLTTGQLLFVTQLGFYNLLLRSPKQATREQYLTLSDCSIV